MPDVRSQAMNILRTANAADTVEQLLPKFYELHTMAPECGLPSSSETGGHILFPPLRNLSAERIAKHGLYLITTSQAMYLYLGSQAHPQLIADVFGKRSFDELHAGKVIFFFSKFKKTEK